MSNLRSLFRGRCRALVLFLALPALVGLAACAPPKEPPPPPPPCTQAPTSTVGPIDFENPPYAVGSINNQDGWKATSLTIDQSVVINALNLLNPPPAEFGDQSWRVSNATTSGSFADQPFSKPLTDEAGESTAENAGQSAGTRQPCFKAEFTVASNTGGTQNGLRITVSPDRGDGARMSFLALAHTANGLNISFSDAQGVEAGETPPCTSCANFVATDLGNFDATVPHTVRFEMQFVEGDSNDVVKVFVDGQLEHTGKSWEDYYRLDNESNQPPNNTFKSRTVDSLLFRMSGTAAPTTLLNGFLVEGVKLESGQ
jgi:hypothetical protein